MQVYNSSLAEMMSKGMNPFSGKGGAFNEHIIVVSSDDDETIEISYNEIKNGKPSFSG